MVAYIRMSPLTTIKSTLPDGNVHVRMTAPSGFAFDADCLAEKPNPTFRSCTGMGRVAVLECFEGTFPAGTSQVALRLTNAAGSPSVNTWLLQSFRDISLGQVKAQQSGALQESVAESYVIRAMIEASVGANTQLGSTTTVYVWFRAPLFIDTGGAVEFHAPQDFLLSCSPRVEYIIFPPGSCEVRDRACLSDADLCNTPILRQYIKLGLTSRHPDFLIYPDAVYQFAVSTMNPVIAPEQNFWGLAFRSLYGQVVDQTMTIPGYSLTNFSLFVQSIVPSTTAPSVVNTVRIALIFRKSLSPGVFQHLTVEAPITTKILCPQFKDMTGGASFASIMLPLDPHFGSYGGHSCRSQNTITLHFDITAEVKKGTYELEIGALNPGEAATMDYWAVLLLPLTLSNNASLSQVHEPVPTNTSTESVNATATMTAASARTVASGTSALPNWKVAQPLLRIRFRGFGIFGAFVLPTAAPVPVDRGCHAVPAVMLTAFVAAFAA